MQGETCVLHALAPRAPATLDDDAAATFGGCSRPVSPASPASPVSPAVTPAGRASTVAGRRCASAHIFSGVSERAVRGLLSRAGDQQAVERARLACTAASVYGGGDSSADETEEQLAVTVKALAALEQKKSSGFRKLLRFTKRSLRII
ncbi:uncharacterized protein LOC116941250 [Petromyzon marinus]|uniref:uncharacterized protein LOC116941250 n=1 Tax=Petromyzon marinus TaxID=7757 RepID=UPI003F6F00DB